VGREVIIGVGGEVEEGGSGEGAVGGSGGEEGGLMVVLGMVLGVMSLEAGIGTRDSLMCRRLMSIIKGSPK
jgi:hypothetical protein